MSSSTASQVRSQRDGLRFARAGKVSKLPQRDSRKDFDRTCLMSPQGGPGLVYLCMPRYQRKLSPRFRIGDLVRIIPTLRLRFANEEGVVQSIVESRYSHTLDKYIVRLEATDLEIEVFDVELRKIHE